RPSLWQPLGKVRIELGRDQAKLGDHALVRGMLRASQLPCYHRRKRSANDGQPCDLQGTPESALQFPRPTIPAEKRVIDLPCATMPLWIRSTSLSSMTRKTSVTRCGSASRPWAEKSARPLRPRLPSRSWADPAS